MIKRIKNKVVGFGHWLIWWAPEVLLVLFLTSLAPLFYLMALGIGDFWNQPGTEQETVLHWIRGNPWTVLAWLACLLGTLGLVAVFVRSRRYIWAVARKMIIEAMHRRVVVVLLVFFVVIMPSLPFILKTEGNLKSQVQIVFSYSLTIAEVLLSLLAVFVCTASICSEVERKQVHLTDTKPLARWQFIFGKLVGVVVVCGALLFVMSASVYGLVRYMARQRDLTALPKAEEARQTEIRRQVFDEVLVARRSKNPPMPDVSAAIETELQRLRDEGEKLTPSEVAEKRITARAAFEQYAMTAKPLGSIGWQIDGFVVDPNSPIYLRFMPRKVNQMVSREVAGEWRFYWRVLPKDAKPTDQPRFVLRGRYAGYWMGNVYQEIPLKNDVVDKSGSLFLEYWNAMDNSSVIFTPGTGIEILQKREGFFPNYYRSLLVILCHIILLSALALMAGAALSFPVASFLVASLFLVGLIAPWMAGSVSNLSLPAGKEGFADTIQAWISWFLTLGLKGIVTIAPHFGRFNALDDLVNGRMVTWSFVGQGMAVLCFLQATAAILLGIYLYNRRELARVIV